MDEAFEDEIRELLASGNKIAAVKRYREQTGFGLAESKAAVESLEVAGSFTQSVPVQDPELTQHIVSLLGRGDKIEAVKLYRYRFRVGLKEAKESVEQIGERNGIPASSGSGCLGIFVIIVAAACWGGG